MSEPRKHHFVPQFLLRGFGDERGGLMVHRIGAARSYLATVSDVGHQNDGHTLYRRDGTIDRRSLEEAMGAIETEAGVTVNELSHGADLDRDRRWVLAWFLALQWRRSRYLLDALAAQVERGDLTQQEFQTALLDGALWQFFSAWRQKDDETASYKDRWDSIVATMMGSFVWSLCIYRDGPLVLGDQTVCMWGVRAGGTPAISAAWARHGIGIGWDDVARVTVPLTPRLGLLLARTEGSRLSAPAFNRATVYNARRFVVHAPNWSEGREAMEISLSAALRTQRRIAPVFYQNQV